VFRANLVTAANMSTENKEQSFPREPTAKHSSSFCALQGKMRFLLRTFDILKEHCQVLNAFLKLHVESAQTVLGSLRQILNVRIV